SCGHREGPKPGDKETARVRAWAENPAKLHELRDERDRRAREHARADHEPRSEAALARAWTTKVARPRAGETDIAIHAGTANALPCGSVPTWMSTWSAARVAADASTFAGVPRAATTPRATSHISVAWRSARSRSCVTTTAAAPASQCARSVANTVRACA